VALAAAPTEEGQEEEEGRVDQEAVDEMFKKTMAAMEGGGRRKGRKGRRDLGPDAAGAREEERERSSAPRRRRRSASTSSSPSPSSPS
jgi:hypothetical protein